jgi:hypothetical protein
MGSLETKASERDTFLCYGKVETGSDNNLDNLVDWQLEENKRFIVQEKVDGSQLSFAVDAETRLVRFFNKNTQHDGEGAPVFRSAMRMIRRLASVLDPALTYHGESFQHPRHNVVVYDRMPRFYCLLYDIQCNKDKRVFDRDELETEARRIGMGTVRIFFPMAVDDDSWKSTFSESLEELESLPPSQLIRLLLSKIENGTLRSGLGGTPEGVVFKHPYFVMAKRTGAMRRKFVTKKFKEVHRVKRPFAGQLLPSEALEWIGSHFDNESRFAKSVQRQRDADAEAWTEAEIDADLDQDLLSEHTTMITEYLTQELLPVRKKVLRIIKLKEEKAQSAAENHDDEKKHQPSERDSQAIPKTRRSFDDAVVQDPVTIRLLQLSDDAPETLFKEFAVDVCQWARKSRTLDMWKLSPPTVLTG